MQIKSSLKSLIRKLTRKAGFDIIRGSHPAGALLCNQGFNIILDVGANVGQYAMRTRRLGYEGKIVSFEPLSAAFTQLTKNAKNDHLWDVANYGMGDADCQVTINISQQSEFSSILNILPMTNEHFGAAADYVERENITIKKLDSIFTNYFQPGDNVLLKIDTQGYEKQVIQGAESSLQYIKGLQLELSFCQLYEGEMLINEMINVLDDKGFTIVFLEPISQGQKLFQADGIFLRRESYQEIK
jgi:FkbM family methyltransferase